MGELQTEPYRRYQADNNSGVARELTFNGFPKVARRGSLVTSRSWSLGKYEH